MVIRRATGAVAYSINGARYPKVPTMLVKRGQLVRIAIANKDTTIHPIHLHGHTFEVLSDKGPDPGGHATAPGHGPDQLQEAQPSHRARSRRRSRSAGPTSSTARS